MSHFSRLMRTARATTAIDFLIRSKHKSKKGLEGDDATECSYTSDTKKKESEREKKKEREKM